MSANRKERPILMSAPMVRAILAGTKTQTRRALRVQPQRVTTVSSGNHLFDFRAGYEDYENVVSAADMLKRCPYAQPGDRLWVRETFAKVDGQTQAWIETDYRATYTHGDRLGDALGVKKRWTPAIHMPRAASRITLEVTAVRVQLLQDITEADAMAEGIVRLNDGGYGLPDGSHYHHTDPRVSYWSLWDTINGQGATAANPWVWAVSFEQVKP